MGVTDEQRSHLEDVPDGAGCTEIWERLSAHRAAATSAEQPAQVDGHGPDDGCAAQISQHRDGTDEEDDPSVIRSP